jgi:hypothetical protein
MHNSILRRIWHSICFLGFFRLLYSFHNFFRISKFFGPSTTEETFKSSRNAHLVYQNCYRISFTFWETCLHFIYFIILNILQQWTLKQAKWLLATYSWKCFVIERIRNRYNFYSVSTKALSSVLILEKYSIRKVNTVC